MRLRLLIRRDNSRPEVQARRIKNLNKELRVIDSQRNDEHLLTDNTVLGEVIALFQQGYSQVFLPLLFHSAAFKRKILKYLSVKIENVGTWSRRRGFDSAKNHKRQRRKRQSVTAKREKSQTPQFVQVKSSQVELGQAKLGKVSIAVKNFGVRLFSFGGYGLALVVFGAYDSYPS